LSRDLYAAVEGGGTKVLCALATAPQPDAVIASVRIDTGDAATTLGRVARALADGAAKQGGRIVGLGVASFGPIELDRSSPHYGHMLATPKPGWSHEPVLSRLAEQLGLPLSRMRWDTDVNAAALGEARWGAGRGADPLVYVTVGTGIGGGVVVDGRPIHGLMHPEIGHLPVPLVRLPDGSLDPFPGAGCPFHDRCWEAMAAGPALAARFGRPAHDVPDDHPVWEIEARYLALGLASCVLTLSPRRIVIGGGVVETRAASLLPRVRAELRAILNGYVPRPELEAGIDQYVVAPGLTEPSSAIAGALALAGEAALG
jgi:fructokinase